MQGLFCTQAMQNLKDFLTALHPISDDTWTAVQPLFTPASLARNELFCDEGKTERKFGFLLSGIIRGYYRTPGGTEFNKHFFVANSIIGGYTSLITGHPNQVLQQALTDCTILVADYGLFTALYDKHTELERVARKFAERYFVAKEQKEIEFTLYDADKRYEIFQQQYPALELTIPQYHIASYLGITPTQLSRIRARQRS